MSRQFTIISSQTRNRLKWELQSLPLQSLISVTEQIMSHFSPVNMYNHNISSFCQSYSDTDGRIQFILSALDQGVVTPNQLPHALKKACGITDSDRKIVPAGFTLQKRKDAESGRDEVVLTDALEVTPTQQVQISNPRWEPIAAEEDSDSEASTDLEDPFLDETIKLLADVKNYPDGASVSFDIYDVTEGTPMRIATVTGTNSGGTASAEWKVEDPQERGDALKLQFEAGARSKYTEKTDLPVQEKLTCDFVEMPDVLFHHNSAVPCLDQEAILLGALTATILFAKENTGKEIVIFGHTDTSGDPAYNFDLSAWRAEGIKALLGGDKDSWLDVVDLASKVEDYQTILATLYTTYGWECDPGAVDNTNGPKTKAAIKSFQEEFNSRYQGALKADGMIGPKTWGALFDTVCSLLKEVLQEETGDTVLPTLTYGYSGSGLYPCGESFPVDSADKDGYKSAANRRVEIVFYDAGKAPKLIKPADKKKVTKREAPVYDKKRVLKKPVGVKPVQMPEVTFFILDENSFNGIDVYEELSLSDKDRVASKLMPPPREDIYSFSTEKKITVDVIIKDVDLSKVFFVCSDKMLGIVNQLNPTASSFKLEMQTGNTSGAFGCLEARIGSKTGKIAGAIWFATYSQVEYKAKIFSVVDSKSVSSKLSKAVTLEEVKSNLSAHFKPGCVSWKLELSPEVNVEYDINNNGALELEPGKTTKELRAIKNACNVQSGFARVIIVKELRWNYYISTNITKTDSQIKLKGYNPIYIGYFGKGTYTISDKKGNRAQIQIKSVDSINAIIILENEVGKDFKLSDKPALLFPLGGLSGDPTLISESSISSKTALLNTIGHELGHTCGNLKDVCEIGNIMYGIVQSDNPPLKLRSRGVPLFYNPSKNEEQWQQLKRT